jgi:glycosidase
MVIQNDSNSATVEKYNRDLPGGRHGGDIQGIIKNLDYISSLEQQRI